VVLLVTTIASGGLGDCPPPRLVVGAGGDRPLNSYETREPLMTRTLGLIGSGNIGSAVARLAIAAGMEVVLSNSRGPETLAPLVAELGPEARAASPAEAATAGDLVVATIPFHAHRSLPADALAGRIVLDTMNYDRGRDGEAPAGLDAGTLTTSELVQQHVSGSRVVKVFSTIYAGHLLDLARPAGAPDRSALPVAGDDAAAVQEVVELLDVLGWDSVREGTIADSWRMALGQPVFVSRYMVGSDFTALATDPGTPVPADTIAALLAAATR